MLLLVSAFSQIKIGCQRVPRCPFSFLSFLPPHSSSLVYAQKTKGSCRSDGYPSRLFLHGRGQGACSTALVAGLWLCAVCAGRRGPDSRSARASRAVCTGVCCLSKGARQPGWQLAASFPEWRVAWLPVAGWHETRHCLIAAAWAWPAAVLLDGGPAGGERTAGWCSATDPDGFCKQSRGSLVEASSLE